MKKIECFIQPSKLDAVETALWENGATGLTVSSVRGFGTQRIRPAPKLRDKLKLEIFVTDEQLDEIVDLIIKTGQTGNMGDGKIAILSVNDLVRIRTGEKGVEAL